MFPDLSNEDFEMYSDSSEENLSLSDLNLSLTFFTGMNGSFDRLENQIFNKMPNYSTLISRPMEKKIKLSKVSRSSSMDFESERPNAQFGANLPLTKSSFNFNLDSNTNYNMKLTQSKSHGKNLSLAEFSKTSQFKKFNPFSFNGSDDAFEDNYETFLRTFEPYTINPKRTGFLPQDIWPDREIPLDKIVKNFFLVKPLPSTNQKVPSSTLLDTSQLLLCKTALKLAIKLYNALKISQITPLFENLVGVSWFQCKNTTYDLIKINTSRFRKLVDFDVFLADNHSDRDLLSYLGFQEMTLQQISSLGEDADLSGIDLIDVKLIYQPEHKFHRNSSMNDILSIKINC